MYLDHQLDKRATCYDRYYRRYYTCSVWNTWVRWLVTGLIIGGAILLFIIFSCLSARRRRKAGFQPYRGTGWAMGQTAAGHGRPQYNNGAGGYGNQAQPSQYGAQQNQYTGTTNNDPTQQPYYSNAPPAYGGNNTGGANQSYYGNTGVTEPSATYGGYKAPEGPPPGR